MDSDLSHDALERFDAIEARLTALEGDRPGPGGASGEYLTEESTEDEEGTTEEA